MKKFHLLLLPTLAFFFGLGANGQLSGYFTVGGSGADYPELPDAITDLYAQGISGNVIFALNPGTYPGVTFTSIPGASEDNTFTLQSGSLDSTDVILSGTTGFDQTSFITIKSVTLSSSADTKVLIFDRSWMTVLENCLITSSFVPYYNEYAAVDLQHSTADTLWTRMIFTKCRFEVTSPCIFNTGSFGRTILEKSIINSEGDFALFAGGRLTLEDNIFNGGLEIKTTTGHSYIRRNEVIGELLIGQIDSLIDNVFISDKTFEVASNYFGGNFFYGPLLRDPNPGSNYKSTFVNNYFECKILISHADFPKMTGNTFKAGVSLSFNKALLFENNRVYGDLKYGTVTSTYWNYKIRNNLFFNCRVWGRGHHSEISYNNFADSAHLLVEYTDISVHDNNFCQELIGNGLSPENINHNNYYPLIYCFYDTSSTHYDPMYQENNPGIATNPMLQGKGWTEAPEKDILGNVRKDPPAMGANEIYICSDSLNNTVTIPCGEELYLNLCNLPDTGSFWWMPDSCIYNPEASYTFITGCSNNTWYLNNSVYGLIDSVSVIIEPFQVEIAEMPLFYCGYERTLNASFHPFASYHWEPETGLSDPFIRNPNLLIEDTNNLQYILSCEIENCGTSTDTINIDFDPLPIVGIYYPEQHEDTVFFSCLSTCTDEYLWDFGDGTFSTEENPYHVYELNAIYPLSLTGKNEHGTRTHSTYYWFIHDFEPYWAPVGATWYYEIVYPFSPKRSFIKYECTGSTFVQNIYCQIITATEGETEIGYLAGMSDTVYTYEHNGKIFVYDPTNENFSLVYDFAAEAGTTWTTTWDTCSFERTISEVDSIEVNGIYLHVLSHGGYSIIERIGGVQTLFHGLGRVDCTGEDSVIYELPFVQQLRCYEDDVLGFYETGVAPVCDHVISAISEVTDTRLSVYPNPASDVLTIKLNDQNFKALWITLHSPIGIIVYSETTNKNQIRLDVSDLDAGLYFLVVHNGDMKKTVRKIIVM